MNDLVVFIIFVLAIGGVAWKGGLGGAIPLIVIMLAFGGIYLYLRGKYYLRETYSDGRGDGVRVGATPVVLEPENPPYATRPILSLADYDDIAGADDDAAVCTGAALAALEYDIVSKNKAEASSAIKRGRLNANHFSTDKLPPDSQIRVEAAAARPAPVGAQGTEGFADIEGGAFIPPDKEAIEANERKVLATYAPKSTAELTTTYSIDDADTLIKNIYKERKQVPTYRVREDGVYEVYEVADENPKIVWEDDVAAAGVARADAPGDYIPVPVAAKQMAANMDPFFEASGRMRSNRGDYTAFTPGLERMFAPTFPTMNWY